MLVAANGALSRVESLAEAAIHRIARLEISVMSKLQELDAQVQATTTIQASAVALIEGLVQRLEEAGTDPEKLAELTTELRSSTATLAAAVEANTAQPAAPDALPNTPISSGPLTGEPENLQSPPAESPTEG